MAICLQANPNLTPEQMAMIIQTAATDLGPAGKDNVFGAGKLNCYQAVLAALALSNIGTVRGTVTTAVNESPIPGVLVEVVDHPQSTQTNGAGQYELTLEAGTYTLRFTHPDYQEATAPVTITPQTVTIVDIALIPATEAVGGPAAATPRRLALAQNQPNPFNPATTISFSLPADGPVALAVYDVRGALVRGLVDDRLAAGEHAVTWDGRDGRGMAVPSGIYLYRLDYRLDANGATLTRRMVLLK
jgi:hypothetical protein